MGVWIELHNDGLETCRSKGSNGRGYEISIQFASRERFGQTFRHLCAGEPHDTVSASARG